VAVEQMHDGQLPEKSLQYELHGRRLRRWLLVWSMVSFRMGASDPCLEQNQVISQMYYHNG